MSYNLDVACLHIDTDTHTHLRGYMPHICREPWRPEKDIKSFGAEMVGGYV